MNTILSRLSNQDLLDLRSLFVERNLDLRFVGGCVRDAIIGQTPKDIDICTDATPTEQIEIYKSAGVSYHETGIEHGTTTVVLNHVPYEITSLRLDVETDGRRATVAYTRDWLKDLERRDFTINAMSLTFDGELVDPFNGLADLHNGLVAFVGDAEARIREDYLRILRWFRFRPRFGMSMSYSARRAIENLAPGLRNISRERVWSEVKRIIAGNDGPFTMLEMHSMGVAASIGLPLLDNISWAQEVAEISRNPVTLMVALYGSSAAKILRDWKASGDELKLADWLINCFENNTDRPIMKYMAVDGVSREWALELSALRRMDEFDRGVISNWEVPRFPVNGRDLLDLGFAQDKNLGYALNRLKELWAENQYGLSKQDLLDHLQAVVK
jgi:tRNA nucleotidyltransferase (CCA-adding enzyme)